MRPLLKPALRRFWRDRRTVQFGVDPDSATVITGLDSALAAMLDDLTGERTQSDVLQRAQQLGADRDAAVKLLMLLTEAGVLDSTRAGMRLSGLAPAERTRLLPDLRSLSLSGNQSGIPALAKRRKSTIAVYGAGRVGGTVAVALAAAGIGRLLVSDRTPARETDLAPGGLDALAPEGDAPGDRASGIRHRIGRFARSTRTSTSNGSQPRPALAIVAPEEEPDRGLVAGLVRLGIPHLVVRVVENRGIVGPFVLPGRTSCVRCSDLYRADRDPAYPRQLAQSLAEQAVTRACDVTLAGMVGNLAAMHALQYVGGGLPDSCGSTVEISAPSGEQNRRRWPAHPECGCHWDHLAEQTDRTNLTAREASEAAGTVASSSAPSDPDVDEMPSLENGADSDDGFERETEPMPEFDLEMAGERLFPE